MFSPYVMLFHRDIIFSKFFSYNFHFGDHSLFRLLCPKSSTKTLLGGLRSNNYDPNDCSQEYEKHTLCIANHDCDVVAFCYRMEIILCTFSLVSYDFHLVNVKVGSLYYSENE